MGLATQWTEIGGSGMMAHGWEPYFIPEGVINNSITFAKYAIGYNMIDAIYQGMKYLAWRNVVVGDPLTTIAWGKQTLTQNLTWSGTNLVTGEICIPNGQTLTFANTTTINFKHNGFITGDGLILTEGEFVLNTNDWNKSLFKSAEDNHPRLIWGAYLDAENIIGYRIYRKWETQGFELVDEVDESVHEFVDTEVSMVNPGNEIPKNDDYYITALTYEEGPSESDPSNTVCYWVEKANKLQIVNQEKVYTDNLAQNYPNPFNPLTQIKYSLKEDALVTLKIFDILGNEVVVLVNERQTEGNHSIDFNSSDLSSGVYIYTLRVNNFTASKKMIVVK